MYMQFQMTDQHDPTVEIEIIFSLFLNCFPIWCFQLIILRSLSLVFCWMHYLTIPHDNQSVHNPLFPPLPSVFQMLSSHCPLAFSSSASSQFVCGSLPCYSLLRGACRTKTTTTTTTTTITTTSTKRSRVARIEYRNHEDYQVRRWMECSLHPKDDSPPEKPEEDPAWTLLTERVSQLREKEIARDRRLAQNWQSGTYSQIILATVSEDYFRKISFRDDFLACGTTSGTVLFYHLPSRKSLQSLHVHIGQITAIRYANSYLASAGATDHMVAVWSCAEIESSRYWASLSERQGSLPAPQFFIQTHEDIVSQITIDGNSNRIYTASLDGQVHVHNLKDGTLQLTINVGEPIYSMVLTEKKYLLVGCASGKVKAYQAQRGMFLLSIPCHKSNTTAIDFFEDNQTLVTGDSSGNIRVWSFRESICLGEIPGHDAAVMSIQVDHAKVVSAGRDGCVSVAMLNSLQRLYTIPGFTKYLATAFFDKSRLIADGTNDLIICHHFDVGIDPS